MDRPRRKRAAANYLEWMSSASALSSPERPKKRAKKTKKVPQHQVAAPHQQDNVAEEEEDDVGEEEEDDNDEEEEHHDGKEEEDDESPKPGPSGRPSRRACRGNYYAEWDSSTTPSSAPPSPQSKQLVSHTRMFCTM